MAPKDHLNIALIGQAFMGRTHSFAWSQVGRFFNVPLRPVMHTVVARSEKSLRDFAAKWGWQNCSTDWKKTIHSADIDLIDIGVPNDRHAEMAIAALRAGKNVSCEKPLAGSLSDARRMAQEARKNKARTFVLYNYRRCPAVAFAHQLVREGRIGKIRHVRGVYLQDWATQDVPLIWRFDKKVAGSGSQGDLNAHVIDMTRFVTGEEITEICGAITETFVKERFLMTGQAAGGIAAGITGSHKKGKVYVDDAVLMLARFSGGAVASFEATRLATGNQNRTGFEINGDRGALRFNFERMNELEFYDASVDRARQGWTTIMCTHGGAHPYAEAWWPDAHVLGYENSFVNQAYDILRALAGQEPIVPLADFEDAYQTQRVLEAGLIAGAEKRWVKMSEVK